MCRILLQTEGNSFPRRHSKSNSLQLSALLRFPGCTSPSYCLQKTFRHDRSSIFTVQLSIIPAPNSIIFLLVTPCSIFPTQLGTSEVSARPNLLFVRCACLQSSKWDSIEQKLSKKMLTSSVCCLHSDVLCAYCSQEERVVH